MFARPLLWLGALAALGTPVAAQTPPAPPIIGMGQGVVVVPMHREPRHHLVLETPGVRLMDVRIPPRDTTIYHHHQFATLYVAIDVSVTDGQPMGRAWGGASPTDAPQRKPGAADVDSSYAATPLTHRVTNLGNGPFRLLAISTKDNAPVVHTGELPGRLEATSSWFRWSRVELAGDQATNWLTATSPTLVLQPGAGETDVTTPAGVARLAGPGAWALVERGARYRVHNFGTAAATALVIQVP
jgi:hypothetical protein